ncbi:hypothetical protein HDU76_000499 [Blyttiomyces sp. JEL0837]|nr:hypothetical protein HDU76_000499 [Blyttiomyces sp. JEL0837]
MHAIDERTKFEKIGKKRVISKKGIITRKEPEDIEENPYASINIEEIWAPLDKPEDLTRNKALSRTLRSRRLKMMSNTAMEFIEQEMEMNRVLSRLVDFVQGDDPLSQEIDFMDCGVPVEEACDFREVVQDLVSTSNEFIEQLTKTRAKLMAAHQRKKKLAMRIAPFKKET